MKDRETHETIRLNAHTQNRRKHWLRKESRSLPESTPHEGKHSDLRGSLRRLPRRVVRRLLRRLPRRSLRRRLRKVSGSCFSEVNPSFKTSSGYVDLPGLRSEHKTKLLSTYKKFSADWTHRT